mgnify:CR=1 FL=1
MVDGVIVGTSASSERRHGLLVSDRELTNFILRAKFRVREGNSGLYFRAEETDTNVAVRGFQAEVDRSSAVGGLYETAMRGWVRKPDPDVIENIVTHGEWVSITVTAIDDDVTVSLNGQDYTNSGTMFAGSRRLARRSRRSASLAIGRRQEPRVRQ